MNWFKSVWLRMRKSNGLPGNEVLIPITDKTIVTTGTSTPVIEEKPKRKYTRKKKDVNNS